MCRHLGQQQESPVEASRGEADRRAGFRFAVWLTTWMFVASFVEGQDRLPAPSADEQKVAVATVNEIFREAASNAKTAAKQLDLARKMLRSLEDNFEAAATNYVLLTQAHGLAVKAFNIGLTWEIIDELDNRYKVDGVQLQLQSIRDIARAPTDSKLHSELVQVAFELVERCIRADQFDVAILAVDQAMVVATKLKSNALRKDATDRKARVAESQKLWEDYRAAVEILTAKSDDAQANESVGRYLIAVKLDFNRGLPHLARGADPDLRAAAKLDEDVLKASTPVSDARAVQLGDMWWDASTKELSASLKTAMRLRASHWYSRVVQNMKGLSKLKTEQRLAESGWRRELELRFEAVMGWLHADFALCQTASFTEAIELNEALMSLRYRPVRFRPYSTPDGLKVAAIWHREDGESRLFHGAEAEIQYRDKELRKQNFWPVDLAGYVADGELRHVAVWSDVKPPNVTYVSLVMSVPDGTLPAEIKVAQPYTYHFYWTPRGDCQYDSLWSQPAGRFEYFRGELEFLKQKQDEYKLTLIDICVNSPSKPTESIPREFGIVLQARNKARVIEVRQTLEKNRLEWKRLATLKHRPVAIGVAVTPAGTTIAHSVWHSNSE